LGPFHGAIAVPSVTRCRCRRCRGHRCAGGARQYRLRHMVNWREAARWANGPNILQMLLVLQNTLKNARVFPQSKIKIVLNVPIDCGSSLYVRTNSRAPAIIVVELQIKFSRYFFLLRHWFVTISSFFVPPFSVGSFPCTPPGDQSRRLTNEASLFPNLGSGPWRQWQPPKSGEQTSHTV